MVRVPTPEEEDRRRISRERKVLTNGRVSHVNRIKGLLFTQGVSGYEPLHRDRRRRLEELKTGDGRPLPVQLKLQIGRELDRLEQIRAVETERDVMLAAASVSSTHFADCEQPAPTMLLALKGIGSEFSAVLWSERLSRPSKCHATVRLLMTAPGVGPITAMAVVAAFDDADRFRRPRICGVSNVMLSCRIGIGNVAGGGNAFVARLLDGCESIRRSVPETALGKQPMKLYETSHRNLRLAHLHAGAKHPVQHPFCDLNDFARLNLDPHNRSAGPILATFVPKTATVKGVPAIMKLYHLPDMAE